MAESPLFWVSMALFLAAAFKLGQMHRQRAIMKIMDTVHLFAADQKRHGR